MKKIYLAGPDVFRAYAALHGAKLKAFCSRYGTEGLFPLDNEIKDFANDRATAMAIFAANKQMMDMADCCVANIAPFRGPNMDPGTAFEIGYMHAQGKRVYAYTNDGNTLEHRTQLRCGSVDQDFPHIENFGLVENLMIIGGAPIIYANVESAIVAASNYFSRDRYLPCR